LRTSLALILALLAAHPRTQRAPAAPRAVPSVAEIRSLLESTDARDQAWGAWWAAQAQARELAPLGVLVEASHAAPAPGPEPAVIDAALDALVQLNAQVPAAFAGSFYERRPTQALILLSRGGPDTSEILLGVVRSGTGIRWFAAANILAGRRAPGLAALLLREIEIDAHVTVIADETHGGGFGDGIGSAMVLDGGIARIPGFPPLANYYMDPWPQPGAILLAPGPTSVYYHRDVSRPGETAGPTFHDVGGPGRRDRLTYVADLVGVPGDQLSVHNPESRAVVWRDQAALDAEVAAFRTDIKNRVDELVRMLVGRKLLTDAEASTISTPIITVRIHDLRQGAMTPPTTQIADRALATLKIPGSADFLAADGDDVWVTNRGRMERLQRDKAAPVASVAVPRPCGGPVVTADSVWVANCTDRSLYRIDRQTAAVVATIPTGLADRSGELSLAEGAGSAWLLTDAAGVLSRIDPKTNTVVARIAVAPNSYAAAFGFDSVWVTNTGARGATGPGALQRIDPATNTVVATIPVGPAPRFLAAGEGAVWTLNQGDGTVSRVDPATNRVVATIDAGVPGTLGDIAAGAGRVWVRATKVLLQAIDPGTNRVLEVFGPASGSGAVRVAGDFVWVSAHDIQTVWVLRGAGR
jgi:DNA-binding beta-propeller fold protein YncE